MAEEICDFLSLPLGASTVRNFSDGEIFVEINQNVRGKDVFVIQATSSPVNAPLMELLIMIDALKRASAHRITAVLPYYGYARQDSKTAPRVPLTAKLVAELITTAGTNQVIAMDLHRSQIQGFFDIPVDHLFSAPVLINYLKNASHHKETVIVSPDTGGVERARYIAERMNKDLAIVYDREDNRDGQEAFNLIGDVEGRTAVIIDDLIDTGATITKAANVLREHGASCIESCVTHAVLSGRALQRVHDSPIERLVVTNTIRLREEARNSSKILCLSVAGLFGEAIKRIHNNDSVSSLFY